MEPFSVAFFDVSYHAYTRYKPLRFSFDNALVLIQGHARFCLAVIYFIENFLKASEKGGEENFHQSD